MEKSSRARMNNLNKENHMDLRLEEYSQRRWVEITTQRNRILQNIWKVLKRTTIKESLKKETFVRFRHVLENMVLI